MLGLNHATFPRWMAIPMGALVGAMLCFSSGERPGAPHWWGLLAAGVVIGLVGGMVIWVVDRPPGSAKSPPKTLRTAADYRYDPERGEELSEPSRVVGRVIALLSLLLICAPIINLILASIGVAMNRRDTGWPRLASWIGFCLALLTTVAFVVLLFLDA